jgi:hypothetical protein
MARGSSYGEKPPLDPLPETAQTNIPRRATRQLPALSVDTTQPVAIEQHEEYDDDGYGEEEEQERYTLPAPVTRRAPLTPYRAYSYDVPHPLERHRNWIVLFTISLVIVVVGAFVLVSAGAFQRPGDSHYVSYPGQSFSIQVGGSYDAFNTWQYSTGPLPAKTPIPAPVRNGPYSVLGQPSVSADLINQVLSAYGSPAAGTGQDMYNLGVKYGIDPVYALAFFMHESLFGTTGEARKTLSLGNLRCIPTRPCVDQDRGGYAQMYSWVDGYEQWYKLIRNLYVAQWGRVTVDQIIPKYAPTSDGNDEAAYIASLKHEVDTWRAGMLRP